jgi:predicted HTH domain antitoxin
MGVRLEIPDDIVQAIRMPEEGMERELSKELSLVLYTRGLLSFGKARELAGMEKFAFGRLLGERGIVRHYGPEELEDDLTYGRGK